MTVGMTKYPLFSGAVVGLHRGEMHFSDDNRTYQLLHELVKAAKEAGEFTEEISTDDICLLIQTMQWGLVDLDNMDTNFDMVGHAKRIGHAMLNALKKKQC